MGPGLIYLGEPNKTKVSEEGNNDYLRYAACSMQGWRINMEDAHISMTSYGGDAQACLFGVFDGHGGREVAEYSRRHFPEELLKNTDYKDGKYEKALKSTFLKIDSLLQTEAGRAEIAKLSKEFEAKGISSPTKRGFEDGAEEEGPEMKGCTANVILIKNKTLYIANAGDSRSIVASKGKAIALSEDHKPDNSGEMKRITKAGGSVIEGRVDGNLNLSRALGDLRYKANKSLKPEDQMITADPEVKIEKLSNDFDFIIMGCDGVYETKTNQQIVEFFYEQFKDTHSGLKSPVEKFLDSNLSPDYMKTEGAGCDNMTCIAIKFKRP